ncbi:transcription elongation factor [Xylariomycetidae sp. FL2044]|nr:transcription elongation factor [Xylariomycetidae sp. FL2044]
MNARELETRVKAITKAGMQQEPAENILGLLNSLKKESSPTEELLRTTRAGQIMNKFARSAANKEVQRSALELVSKWKKSVESEKKAKSLQHQSQIQGSASPAGSPAPKPIVGNNKSFTGNPDTRTYRSDQVDIKRTGSLTRDNCIGLMYNGLAFRSRESEENVILRAVEIESAAYKAYHGETKEYKEKMRSLFQNLKVKTNPELGRNVMSGRIAADRFVVMTSKELMSAAQRQADAEAERENMKKAQVPMAEKSISDSLECSNCKKKMVSYTQAQTRSADEPMTTFCECMNCGKRWKFS